MAKVKIQGNASGTGVLTVTAPNTSTDRTITLPDATGTLLNSDGDGSSLTGVADATKLPLAGGTMTGDLVVSADVDITGSLNGTSGSLDIKNEANNQNVFIKTTSAGSEVTALKIHSGGVLELPSGGLRVGGTAAANTLDDYEEGTWTPTLSGSSSGPSGVNFAIRLGWYTKIGRQVNVSCYVGLTSWSSGPSGNATIDGLPFVASNSTTYHTTISTGYTLNFDTDNTPDGGFIEVNKAKMRLIKRASADARNNINNSVSCSALNGTEYIIASATYFTDS